MAIKCKLIEIVIIILIFKYSFQSRIQFKELDHYAQNLTTLIIDSDNSNTNLMIALYVNNHAYVQIKTQNVIYGLCLINVLMTVRIFSSVGYQKLVQLLIR